MKVLLVYPPFCSPASPPYSLTNIYAFLKNNLQKDHQVAVLDLNVEFHRQKFPEYQMGFQKGYAEPEYQKLAKEYMFLSKKVYRENNKKIVHDEQPELFDEMMNKIIEQKPDIVAMSLVYSSQSFYAHSLIKKLKEEKIKIVIGGPAVNDNLAESATHLEDETELLEYILKEDLEEAKLKHNNPLDFSIYNLNDYFTNNIVIPIKTSSTCYYQKCAFCTHHGKKRYAEYPLEQIEKTIEMSRQKHFFIIDDMMHKKRILEIAGIMKKYKAKWICQLKPTKEFDLQTLNILKDSGLAFIIWGVESASNRILDLMKKQTNKEDIRQVIKDTSAANIKNVVFIMFGFPTETKDEFLETIRFLKDNEKYISLVSTSTFGLQKDTPVYKNKEDYGITSIELKPRTILEPSITYKVKSGLSQEEAKQMKKAYKKTLENINKYPKEMNFFREHMILAE